MRPTVKTITALAFAIACLLSGAATSAHGEGGLRFVETADGARSARLRQLIQWTHTRLVFGKDLRRVAVGQKSILEAEILGGREVLLLAKEVGRTSLIVWYPDESTETFLLTVIEDRSVLQRALRDIHPSIYIEQAPDRAALVLRGTVPTVDFKVAAEAAARDYLDVGNPLAGAPVVVRKPTADATDFRLSPDPGRVAQAIAPASTAAIINLIQVEQLPLTVEQKVEQAIREIGGADVRAMRIRRGDVADDLRDSLILRGTVHNQVDLVRVLNVAARLFIGPEATVGAGDMVRVVADESGTLVDQRGSGLSGAAGSRNGGFSLGGQSGSSLENEIKANVGRAKLIAVAGGRILSVIEVRDLPQVRVSVQLHEVNRRRLKSWRPDLTLVSGGYRSTSISPQGSGMIVQPDRSERVGASGFELENALQVLGGALTNNLQVGGTKMAFDLLLSLMENEGIARTLSRPTLTVLAGEPAVFQVGGEVPVPSAFAPFGGGAGSDGTAAGVFSGTEFKAFGVELKIRPMVGDDDRITLDVHPTISLPDPELSARIAESTGTPLSTAAFNTRSLQTTTRLRDGQPLVIGGLVSRTLSDDQAFTPGLASVPVVGWVAKTFDDLDDDRELIIVVTPTIVREPFSKLGLWQSPDAYELLTQAVGTPDPARLPSELRPRSTDASANPPILRPTEPNASRDGEPCHPLVAERRGRLCDDTRG